MSLYTKHPYAEVDSFVAPSASVVGDVTVGPQASVWYGAVVRGDVAPVVVGAFASIGDRAVLHGARGAQGGVRVGEYARIGAGASLHACVVEHHASVGAGAVVMEGAVVEAFATVLDGSVVHPNRRVPKGEVWGGNPAVFLRPVSKEDMAAAEEEAETTSRLAQEHKHEFLEGAEPRAE